MSNFKYGVIFKAVYRLFTLPLSPLVSCPLLFAATLAPNAARDVLSSVLSVPVEDDIVASTKVALRILVGVGILRWLNWGLNSAASNSWRLRTVNQWNWASEIVVVTGGSSGIGQGIVTGFVDLGTRVAILDVQAPLDKTFRSNPLVRYYECDVTSTQSIAAAADAIRSSFGQPTVLVNNAGITNFQSILTLSESSLRKITGVNLLSHWFTTQEFLPHMIKINKGHIITVASIASFVALPGSADYGATKAGALAFHEALTTEVRHYHNAPGVLTTVVHPNYVRTPLIAGAEKRLEGAGVSLLDSGRVSDEIVDRVKSGKGGQLIIGAPSLISGIRGWPLWMQTVVRDMIPKSSSEE